MPFKKGKSKTGGRGKGVKNKFTTLKDAFINAFQTIGGEQALIDWVTPKKIEIKSRKGKIVRVIDLSGNRKREFFKMLASMLPKDVQLSGANGEPLFPYKNLTDGELDGLLERLAQRTAKK